MNTNISTIRETLFELADFAAKVSVEDLVPTAIDALKNTLLDSFGVAIAGARTEEFANVLEAWHLPPGDSNIWGTEVWTDPQTATLMVGVALCSLELDEGNKLARGHPGAHVIPAAIAEAQRIRSSGSALLSAIVAGYEVATRFAIAFEPVPGLHTHGHWGALGAAVAVGKLHEFSAEQLAQAMDAASALPLASPFSSAIDGAYVRNMFVGLAGINGIAAARLTASGLGSVNATASFTYNEILGKLHAEKINVSTQQPWTITQGYFKRHSACAYTHAAADAAVQIRSKLGDKSLAEIESVRVQTYGLASQLDNANPTSRLGAMFSIPHVVAVALSTGAVQPDNFSVESIHMAELSRVREVTVVETDTAIDEALPHKRGARVSVRLFSGEALVVEVPNAIGDSDYFPLNRQDIEAKITNLIGRDNSESLSKLVDSISTSNNVFPLLASLEESKIQTVGAS